jgi:hypothetical protein
MLGEIDGIAVRVMYTVFGLAVWRTLVDAGRGV